MQKLWKQYVNGAYQCCTKEFWLLFLAIRKSSQVIRDKVLKVVQTLVPSAKGHRWPSTCRSLRTRVSNFQYSSSYAQHFHRLRHSCTPSTHNTSTVYANHAPSTHDTYTVYAMHAHRLRTTLTPSTPLMHTVYARHFHRLRHSCTPSTHDTSTVYANHAPSTHDTYTVYAMHAHRLRTTLTPSTPLMHIDQYQGFKFLGHRDEYILYRSLKVCIAWRMQLGEIFVY